MYIVSLSIVKVCLFPHSIIGFLLFLIPVEAFCVTATCWGQIVELSVWWMV